MPHRTVMAVRQPVGVAGLLISFNTPLPNVAWKVFPAIFCGNGTVLKPSEETPRSAQLFAHVCHEVGLPAGVLNVVQGLGGEAGAALVEHPQVDLVSFTGSAATGRWIAEAAGRRLAKVCLELGGKNALVVCDDADLDDAVRWAVQSAFSNAGQRCAAASRESSSSTPSTTSSARRFVEAAQEFADTGPVISEASLEPNPRCPRAGSRGGRQSALRRRASRRVPGWWLAPTVAGRRCCRRRALLHRAVRPRDDPLSRPRPRGGAERRQRLAVRPHVRRFTRRACTERCALPRRRRRASSSSTAGTHGSEPHMGFGGVKQSGTGWREAGVEALDVYSEWKYVNLISDPAEGVTTAVLGPGAVGGALGVRLALAGERVICVARPETAAAIARERPDARHGRRRAAPSSSRPRSGWRSPSTSCSSPSRRTGSTTAIARIRAEPGARPAAPQRARAHGGAARRGSRTSSRRRSATSRRTGSRRRGSCSRLRALVNVAADEAPGATRTRRHRHADGRQREGRALGEARATGADRRADVGDRSRRSASCASDPRLRAGDRGGVRGRRRRRRQRRRSTSNGRSSSPCRTGPRRPRRATSPPGGRPSSTRSAAPSFAPAGGSAFPHPPSRRLLAAMPSVIALIGARSGSERVPHKNIRPLAGHPLLAYAIATAQQAGVFERVRRARPTPRRSPRSRAGTAPTCPSCARRSSRRRPRRTSSGSRTRSTRLPERYDLFAIVRATNPFRGPDVVRRGLEQLLATPEADSIRAVELVKQHPGKMWELADDGRTMTSAARPVRTSMSPGMRASTRRCRPSITRTARSRSRGRASSPRPARARAGCSRRS